MQYDKDFERLSVIQKSVRAKGIFGYIENPEWLYCRYSIPD